MNMLEKGARRDAAVEELVVTFEAIDCENTCKDVATGEELYRRRTGEKRRFGVASEISITLCNLAK